MTVNIQQNISPRRSFNNSSSWHSGQKTAFFNQYSSRDYSQKGNINSTTLTLALSIVTVLCVAALGFFYLGQVMNTASHGSDVQALAEKMVELKEEQRELELESARLRSIQNVENKINQLDLVDTERVAYLKGSANNKAFASAE